MVSTTEIIVDSQKYCLPIQSILSNGSFTLEKEFFFKYTTFLEGTDDVIENYYYLPYEVGRQHTKAEIVQKPMNSEYDGYLIKLIDTKRDIRQSLHYWAMSEDAYLDNVTIENKSYKSIDKFHGIINSSKNVFIEHINRVNFFNLSSRLHSDVSDHHLLFNRYPFTPYWAFTFINQQSTPIDHHSYIIDLPALDNSGRELHYSVEMDATEFIYLNNPFQSDNKQLSWYGKAPIITQKIYYHVDNLLGMPVKAVNDTRKIHGDFVLYAGDSLQIEGGKRIYFYFIDDSLLNNKGSMKLYLRKWTS